MVQTNSINKNIESQFVSFLEKIQKRGAFILVFSFIVISVSYNIITPTYEGSDEDVGVGYIIGIHDNGIAESTGSSVPFYYWVGALYLDALTYNEPLGSNEPLLGPHGISVFLHGPDSEKFPFHGFVKQVHLLRLYSIACGAVTVFVTYKISRRMFTENQWFSFLPPSFLILIPSFPWLSAAINNNNLLITLSTISLFFLIKVLGNPNKKNVLILGVFVGLDLITKGNAYIFPPIILSVFGLQFFQKKWNLLTLLKNTALFLIPMFVIFWKFLFKDIGSFTFKDPSSATTGTIQPNTAFNTVTPGLFDHFWSGLGTEYYSDTLELRILYSIITFFFAAFVITFFIKKQKKSYSKEQKNILTVSIVGIVLFALVFVDILAHGIGQSRNISSILPEILILVSVCIFYACASMKRYKKILIIGSLLSLMAFGNFLSFVGYDERERSSQIMVDPIITDPTTLTFDNVQSKIMSYYNVNSNLQKLFPEVKNNNFTRLANWTYFNFEKLHNIDISNLTIHNLGSYDRINNKILNQNKQVTLDRTDYVGLVGWSLSDDGKSVDLVYVFVDDKPAALANYGLWRVDVAHFYGNGTFPQPGWNAIFSPSSLAKGCHKIDAVILSNNTFTKQSTDSQLCVN